MSILEPQQTIVSDPLLTTQELARLASIKPRTLEKWRLLGLGPSYIRLGNKTVRYRVSAVDAWIRQVSTEHVDATSEHADERVGV